MAETTTSTENTSSKGLKISHWFLVAAGVLGTVTGFLSGDAAKSLIEVAPWLSWVTGLGAVLTGVAGVLKGVGNDLADDGKLNGSAK